MTRKYPYPFPVREGVIVLLLLLGTLHSIVHAQCISAGSPIHFEILDNNTTPGYTTVYVLTDADGKILKTVTEGFAAPDINGTYYLYAVNYRTSGIAPITTPGTPIGEIGGDCAAASRQPAQFCVSNGCFATGSTIAFQVTGNNTSTGFVTRYVLTDSNDRIISSHTESPVTAPPAAGTYRIYAVNYDTNGGKPAPVFDPGTALAEIGGACTAVSQTPITFCASSQAMPVKLMSFSLAQENGTVLVNWTTSEELNAEKFEIQRSHDVRNWSRIGERAARGNSGGPAAYQFTDPSPFSGLGYYRLKMIDRDRTFTFSRIESIQMNELSKSTAIYPNPGSELLLLKKSRADAIRSVTLTSPSGVVVLRKASFPTEGINISNLSAGTYLLEIVLQNGRREYHRVAVAR